MIRISLVVALVILLLNLAGCSSAQKAAWERRGDKEAQGVLSKLTFARLIVRDSFENSRRCLEGVPNLSLLKEDVKIKGNLKIENGYLFISSMEFDNSQVAIFKNENANQCLSKEVGAYKRNVANGLSYTPALLGKVFLYEFHGSIAPKISGEVKAVNYDKIEEF